MHANHKRSIQKNLKASIKGLGIALREEISFRIIGFAAVLSVIAMSFFPLSRTERAVVWVMIFSVLVLELINSIVERLLDLLYPEDNDKVGAIKDLMAGIVLIAALGSFVIAWLIFAPKVSFLKRFFLA
ncbi:MAG: diacylglycerol kinase [Parcubacteria group bacterium]|nr:diacylglycerol kinase [Parcubacteria group bacterium]